MGRRQRRTPELTRTVGPFTFTVAQCPDGRTWQWILSTAATTLRSGDQWKALRLGLGADEHRAMQALAASLALVGVLDSDTAAQVIMTEREAAAA